MSERSEGMLVYEDPDMKKAEAAITNWTNLDQTQRKDILILLTGVPGFDGTSWGGKSIDELATTLFIDLPHDLQIELVDCAQIDGDSFEL